MRKSRPLLRISLEAAATIKRGQAIKISSGKAAIANTHAEDAIGISDDAAATGAAVDVVVAGIARGLAGGTIAAGKEVAASTGGKISVTTSASARVIGIALQAAVSGDEINVLVNPSNY